MTKVYLSLGSNIDRRHNIESALTELQSAFGELSLSPVYESEAVGFDGSAFYNMIVGIKTGLSPRDLSKKLKFIEDRHGRDRTGPKFGSRTLDIDIVCYGQQVGEVEGIELPRAELYYNAFVLWPLADIAGTEIDPKTGKSFGTLRHEMDTSQKLWPVAFYWQGREIFKA